MKKICLGLNGSLSLTAEEQIAAMAEIGFDACFFGGNRLPAHQTAKRAADAAGIAVQSLHAPFGKAADMWHGTAEAAEKAIKEMTETVEIASELGIPIVVMHAFIGFDRHEPNETGVENYGRVIRRASELGVSVALENTEGEEYLAALLSAFREERHVGFCLDTGHEMCYNEGRDLLARYGDRLIATHLNDNLGIREPGKITWLDDLHLLPSDGAADWGTIAARLKKASCPEYLTFELNTVSKPGGHENDAYGKMDPRAYLSLVFEHAVRFRTLYEDA